MTGTVTTVAAAAGEQVALGATAVRRRPVAAGRPRRAGGLTVRPPQVVRDPSLPERVTIYEVGPRDGLQNESAVVPLETKAEFLAPAASRPGCRSSRRPASCTRSGCRSSPTPPT